MFRSTRAILAYLAALPAFCQPPMSAPAFDVAEVKPNKSGGFDSNGDFDKGGRVTVRNLPLKYLIALGYHVRLQDLEGAPGWTESERFDIVAKAPPSTSEDDLRRMLITLLQERFKLATHTDRKVASVYALVVGKGGPKNLKESTPPAATEQRCHRAAPPAPGDVGTACQHISMADFAEYLANAVPGYIQMPVVDQTGIQGFYEFELFWTPAGRLNAGPGRGGDAGTENRPAIVGSGASVFDALQSQLGLKLDSKKLPMPVIVVDRVERLAADN